MVVVLGDAAAMLPGRRRRRLRVVGLGRVSVGPPKTGYGELNGKGWAELLGGAGAALVFLAGSEEVAALRSAC